MEAFFVYTFKVGTILSLFYFTYYFLLKKNTFFVTNRHFLLAGIITSLLLPFVEFTTIKLIESPGFFTQETTSSTAAQAIPERINWWLLAFIAYIFGILIFFTRFMLQLVSLRKLFTSNDSLKKRNFNLIEVTDNIAPFSFFNTIVYNPKLHSQEELDIILKHEKIHIEQYHTIDVIIINLILIFQWINPLAWLYKKSLEQNLEFIADHEAIDQVMSKKEYLLTLVKVSSNNYTTITNNFYQSLIKKRIIMLNKQNSKSKELWKIATILPLLSLFIWSFNTTEIIEIKQDQKIEQNGTENVIFQKEGDKIIKHKVHKTSTKEDLENIKKSFKNNYNVEVKFTGIQRNNNDEITSIKVNISSQESNTNYALQNDSPINSFVIVYNSTTDKISIGQSKDHSKNVWILKNGKEQVIEINTDDNDDEEHEFIFSGNAKNKVMKIKSKDGKIIREEIHVTSDKDKVFEINTDDNKTFAFVTSDSKAKPLIFINGKESTEKEIKKLKSEEIETIQVLKGDTAVKKYGKKAENGVVEVTTKKK